LISIAAALSSFSYFIDCFILLLWVGMVFPARR
jgi:hypothetical protein